MAGRTGRQGQIVTPQERELFLKHVDDPLEEISSSSSEEQLPKTDKKSKRSSSKRKRRSRSDAPAIQGGRQEKEEGCRVCGKDNDHDKLMICEMCEGEYHYYCLNPPLKAVPEGQWFCENCNNSPSALAEEDDGLDALICALPPKYTERFGEIVWAQGGVGFGWWPACIYDPRLTVGGARELAKKNLGRKHLTYFFECHMAPFAVLADSKLIPWEQGLIDDYHLGKAAHQHGKARALLFRQALHIATMEDAKPIDSRMVWNHTGDEAQEMPLSPEKSRRARSTGKRKRGRPHKNGKKLKGKRRRRSADSDTSRSPSVSVSRTNLLHAISVHHSSPKKVSNELFCRVIKREKDASDNEVDVRLGFITLQSPNATFEDARIMVLEEMDPQSLPGESWKFYLPSLGPVSHKQEQSLGPVVKFLSKAFDRKLGDGTVDNPLHLVLVAVP